MIRLLPLLLLVSCSGAPPDYEAVTDRKDAHDDTFRVAAAEHTGHSDAEVTEILLGWRVELHPRPLYTDDGRAYFEVSSHPGWLIWGLADCAQRVIILADLDFGSGVLAHEYGHALTECYARHEDFPALGLDAATAYVQQHYVTNAYGEPPHPAEGCPMDAMQLTGAHGGEAP